MAARMSDREFREIALLAPIDAFSHAYAEASRARESEAALLEAVRACLEYIPGSEVRSWPPGFDLKRKALALSRAAIAKAEAP
jgi:hypothetical protein